MRAWACRANVDRRIWPGLMLRIRKALFADIGKSSCPPQAPKFGGFYGENDVKYNKIELLSCHCLGTHTAHSCPDQRSVPGSGHATRTHCDVYKNAAFWVLALWHT